MFSPQTEYEIVRKDFRIEEFQKYADDYVTRPPYQRKNVWSRKKQQDLLDSLFRGYYIPRIVLREIRLADDKALYEVIDGQQRITTAQRFIANELPLPKTLDDVSPQLPGARYEDLGTEIRRFVDRELRYTADLVKGIQDPEDPRHQEIATEIFWRLQQGESLNYMEEAHSRLSSIARNFVVKFADDQRFDYDAYTPIDGNPDKLAFFSVIDRKNDRMQHLALLTRLLILEEAEGPTDIKQSDVMDYIDSYIRDDGIGNLEFEEYPAAKRTLRNLRAFHKVFQDDPMVKKGDGMKEFKVEYYIISAYLLVRRLQERYVLDDRTKELLRDFLIGFYERFRAPESEADTDAIIFSDKRQQNSGDIETRDRILRQAFFEFAQERDVDVIAKDTKRAFSEAQRIRIYRRDNGLCQACIEQGFPEDEALVPWDEFDADHLVPHSQGGSTTLDNAQLLCRKHNREKGAEAM